MDTKEQEAIYLLAELLTSHKRRGEKTTDGAFNWLYGEIKRVYRDFNINLPAQLLQNALMQWKLDQSMEILNSQESNSIEIYEHEGLEGVM